MRAPWIPRNKPRARPRRACARPRRSATWIARSRPWLCLELAGGHRSGQVDLSLHACARWHQCAMDPVAPGVASRYHGHAMRVDLIFEGGRLQTMDPVRPRATALAVLGGRIVAVGDGDELRRHLDAKTVVSLLGIHDMVNQRTASGRPFNPAEALTAEQAIRCYTLHSARAAFREADLGSLEPGSSQTSSCCRPIRPRRPAGHRLDRGAGHGRGRHGRVRPQGARRRLMSPIGSLTPDPVAPRFVPFSSSPGASGAH